MSLGYELTPGPAAIGVRLAGRIDADAGSTLDEAFAAASASASLSASMPAVVEFDFENVDYINSTGIAVIVGVLAQARAQGQSVRAHRLSPHYQHVFEITRLSDFIEIVPPIGH